jgi:hypothetical protein
VSSIVTYTNLTILLKEIKMYIKSTKSEIYHLNPSYRHQALFEYVCSLLLLVVRYKSVCLSIYLSIYLFLYSPLSDLGRFFTFLILYIVRRTPWTGDQPVARPLPTHSTIQTQSKRTQTSIPWVRFEPTIPGFERVKTVHALDRAATVIAFITSQS